MEGLSPPLSTHPPPPFPPLQHPPRKFPGKYISFLSPQRKERDIYGKLFFFFFPLTFVVLVERELEVGHAFEFLFTPAKKRTREIIVSCSVFLFSFARSHSCLSCVQEKKREKEVDPWADKEQPAIFLFFPFLLKTGVRLNHS